ncbi:MAG: carbohydrate binding family 9 domain-containing protein, partial [Acidobacteriota bacterium]
MSRTFALLGILASLGLPMETLASAADPPVTGETRATRITYPIRFTEDRIKIDGELTEEAWHRAEPIPLDYEWFPGNNVVPPVVTQAYVVFDTKNIYVAFRCEDPNPARIRAHYMDRDQVEDLVRDDHVLVQFDTFDDQRRAFQFRVNPLGVQADAIYSDVGGIEDFSWDMIWTSAGSITDSGYVVEAAFPLNQLRLPAGKQSQVWGIDLGRSYPRNVRHRISNAMRNRNDACQICQWNKISGLENLDPGRNLELDPTLTGIRTDE